MPVLATPTVIRVSMDNTNGGYILVIRAENRCAMSTMPIFLLAKKAADDYSRAAKSSPEMEIYSAISIPAIDVTQALARE